MPTMSKDDLLHLKITDGNTKTGCSIFLDDKHIHHTTDYEIKENKAMPGTAILKLELWVKFP